MPLVPYCKDSLCTNAHQVRRHCSDFSEVNSGLDGLFRDNHLLVGCTHRYTYLMPAAGWTVCLEATTYWPSFGDGFIHWSCSAAFTEHSFFLFSRSLISLPEPLPFLNFPLQFTILLRFFQLSSYLCFLNLFFPLIIPWVCYRFVRKCKKKINMSIPCYLLSGT